MRRLILSSGHVLLAACFAGMAAGLAACNEQETAMAEQTYGAEPALPAPEKSLIPTVNVAKAVGWPAGGKPIAAAGMAVNPFATGLDHPRTLLVLPNGDVLVAETNAPSRPDEERGIKGWITKLVMSRAGADTQSANRITFCAMPMATALPKPEPSFSIASIPRSAWRWWATTFMSPIPTRS
jgi:glucose/arabinose dehydrogenase